jgi:hypothetical protein
VRALTLDPVCSAQVGQEMVVHNTAPIGIINPLLITAPEQFNRHIDSARINAFLLNKNPTKVGTLNTAYQNTERLSGIARS